MPKARAGRGCRILRRRFSNTLRRSLKNAGFNPNTRQAALYLPRAMVLGRIEEMNLRIVSSGLGVLALVMTLASCRERPMTRPVPVSATSVATQVFQVKGTVQEAKV